MSNLKKYNRFLVSDEKIPRTTLYRRQKRPRESASSADQIDASTLDNQNPSFFDEDNRNSCTDFSDDNDFHITANNESYQNEWTSSETSEDEPSSSHGKSHPGNDYLGVENPFSPLYPSADVSNIEAFECILAYCVRFNLTGTSIDELLRMLKILLPPCILPGTKYLLNKSITSSGKYENFFEIHLYCQNCGEYISKVKDKEEKTLCTVCKEQWLTKQLLNDGIFFLYIPLEEQLKRKLENQRILTDIQNYRADCIGDGNLKDLICGESYPLSTSSSCISLQFNLDGLPLYNKAKYDLWPIHCMINELSPTERKEHLMMCGLWFGSKKPIIKTYLTPFVSELSGLAEKGLLWNNNGKNCLLKVIPLLCTADAPARAMIQNFTQYNGWYGCGFCEHQGETVARGRGHCRVFPLNTPVPVNRDFEKTLAYAEEAISNEAPVKGVKGPSLFMKLYPIFNYVDGFVPDYMHAVLLGVTRQFVNLWINTSDASYCLRKKNIKQVNDRISMLKEPSEMKRKLRSLAEVSHWKASEWRVFLLVSPILMLNILPSQTYNHWLLLVHGISLLLGSHIREENLQAAGCALEKFVRGVSQIYGEGELTYNVHLLLHLTEKVRAWGPLWASSCFSFEDALGKLKNFHQGTKGVPMQILFAYYRKYFLQSLMQQNNLRNDRVTRFVEDMNNGKRRTKNILKKNNVTLFGCGRTETLSVDETEAAERIINLSSNGILSYKRIIYKGMLLSTKNYSSQFNRIDSIVSIQLSKINYVQISKIVVYNDEVVFLGTKLKVKKFSKKDIHVGNLCDNILCVQSNNCNKSRNSLVAFKIESVLQKYTKIKLENDCYLIPLLIHAEE